VSAGLCASCGSDPAPGASFCWLCGYPLGAGAAPVARIAQASPAAGIGWVVAFVVALFVLSGVGLELAFLWPGLLIPYAAALVPVLVVMTRILYVQRFDFWEGSKSGPAAAASSGAALAPAQPASGATREAPDGSSDVVAKVVTTVAVGMAGTAIAIGLLMLLAVAAFVFLVAICFAAILVLGH